MCLPTLQADLGALVEDEGEHGHQDGRAGSNDTADTSSA